MRTFALIIALAIFAGVPNLPRPMHGDQILFLQGGESLSHGELLYRDFWDIKQPAVFAFYWVGGELFGFTEDGIHLFDLLYWLAFAFLVATTWPRLQGDSRASIWPAITTVGWYWALTGSVQQTQVEALIGPLLYLHIWLLIAATKRKSPIVWWATAGSIATVVVMFKLMFVPLLGVAWLFAAAIVVRRFGWRSALKLAGVYISVGLVTTVASLTPWIVAGELGELKRTFFDYPSQMMQEIPKAGTNRLVDAATWFSTRFGPLLVLAVMGAIRMSKRGQRQWLVFLASWIFVGLGIIAIQRLSWWSYHFLLISEPIGLLAANGCIALAEGELLSGFGKPFRLTLLGVLLMPAVGAIAIKWAPVAQNGFCLTEADRQADRLSDSTYLQAREETAFLHEATSREGAIYVAGEPICYRFANREPAVPIHGWSLELYPVAVREKLSKQLIDARPAYVFVDRSYYGNLIEDKYPMIAALLRSEYRVVRESKTGTWYERIRT